MSVGVVWETSQMCKLPLFVTENRCFVDPFYFVDMASMVFGLIESMNSYFGSNYELNK